MPEAWPCRRRKKRSCAVSGSKKTQCRSTRTFRHRADRGIKRRLTPTGAKPSGSPSHRLKKRDVPRLLQKRAGEAEYREMPYLGRRRRGEFPGRTGIFRPFLPPELFPQPFLCLCEPTIAAYCGESLRLRGFVRPEGLHRCPLPPGASLRKKGTENPRLPPCRKA